MLGFRSNKLWKKIVSITYLVFIGFFTLGALFEGKYENMSVYDYILTKLEYLFMILVMASPYIFLSNTPIRQKLPLFKSEKKVKRIVGFILVNVMFIIPYGICSEIHSKEYLEHTEKHNYKVNVKKEATCENVGKAEYVCDYCGEIEEKVIPALGHDMEEVSKKEATCKKDGKLCEECKRCKEKKETVLKALGHDMEEVSKKEATCKKDGKLCEKCKRCKEKKETVLKALGHDMEEVSKKEATCEKEGKIVKKCKRCKETKNKVLKALGHDMKEVSKKEPTLTKDGKIVKKCTVCGKEKVKTLRKLGETESEYKAKCGKVSYKSIARNPDDYKGKRVKFKGKVVQVQEMWGSVVIRLNVTCGAYGIWDDTIYIEYTRKEGESRILEDDIVTVYGELKGLKTYETVLGSMLSIPYLKAKYIDLN